MYGISVWLFWNRTFVLFLIEVKANSFDFRVLNTCRKFEFFPFHISRHDSKLQKTESNILIYEYETWFLIFFFINMSVINNHIHSHFIILSTCLELNCTIKQLFKSKTLSWELSKFYRQDLSKFLNQLHHVQKSLSSILFIRWNGCTTIS